MKTHLLIVVMLATGCLTGCSDAEQSKMLTDERKAVSRVQNDIETTAASTNKVFGGMKTEASAGVQKLRESGAHFGSALSRVKLDNKKEVEVKKN